jgi:acyl-coenzyme A synthetase/AMP-(fatty) acid ligase
MASFVPSNCEASIAGALEPSCRRSSLDDGSQASPGELGQIAVTRPDPVMFLEYWGLPTREKFIGDWMTTGDQGIVDEDSYFHFVGRDDDVITASGYRIGPGEIEDCLIRHPPAALAAAVGKPDPIRAEIVKAFIMLKPGQHASDALHRSAGLASPRDAQQIHCVWVRFAIIELIQCLRE